MKLRLLLLRLRLPMKKLLFLAALVAACSAQAQGTSEALQDYSAIGITPATSTAGWTFETTANLTATELGCFANVFANNSAATSVEVGLWAPDGTLLASTFINPGSAPFGLSLYEPIDPVFLYTGNVYHIGLFFPPDGNSYSLDASIFGSYTVAPDITVLGTALATATDKLSFPVAAVPPDKAIYAGANFQYQQGVPEPAAGLMLFLGGLLFVIRRGAWRR
jgi:hypothetical protein